MRFLIIFIFFVSSAISDEVPKIKNLVINKELKIYDKITFLDANEKVIKLSDYKGNLVLMNFLGHMVRTLQRGNAILRCFKNKSKF